jgi:hypothetical protein
MTERLDPYELFADDEWDVAIGGKDGGPRGNAALRGNSAARAEQSTAAHPREDQQAA